MALFGRQFVIALAVALAAALVLPAGQAATATTPTLVDVRAAHYPGYDRLVFEFAGGRPQAASVRWSGHPRLDPSDRAARIQGNAFLTVTFRGAAAHEPDPPAQPTFGPLRQAFALPNLTQVVLLGDYEGVVSLGVGLMKRTRIVQTIELSQPYRLVVHVATRFPKRTVRVYFVDERAIVQDESPYVRPVTRKVPAGAATRGALQRLYAGPTVAEQARGLRLIRSHTYSFRHLRVNPYRVARVQLRGRCNSDGSALVTVADQVRATLRARPGIEWVKIYGPDGTTQWPRGRRHSDPACLQP